MDGVVMYINSIYAGINGEVSLLGQGSLCTFIRLQGCNLSCKYCDTKKSQKLDKLKAEFYSPEQIYLYINDNIFPKNFTITGGEPLTQKTELLSLVRMLKRYVGSVIVSVETNGSLMVNPSEYVDSWVVDWKAPSSGMRDNMKLDNFAFLGKNDFIKFTIKDKYDFDDAVGVISKTFRGEHSPKYAFSPQVSKHPDEDIPKKVLIDWMLRSRICVDVKAILNLQIHKIIGVA
jgi:7-carboxy-7-deazaguanine synthase